MLLNEVSPDCALLSILDKISGNSPNKIHKAGYSFDNYNKDEYFTDEDGNKIRAIDFLKRYYVLAKEKGLSTQEAKNNMFYFLYPVEKKFKIPETYQKLKFKKKLLNGREITEVRPLSRYIALDILLTDIFCGFEKSYNVALTDSKSAPLLKIFREKPLVDDEGVIDKLNTENKSLFKNDKLNENKLFEYILQEANKDRFLSKLYELYNDIEESYNEDLAIQFYFVLGQNNIDPYNYYEPLLAFVNSNVADKYKLNWQQRDQRGLFKSIIEAFMYYLENGTKSQNKKLAKLDARKVFYNSGLNVVESGEDCSNADFIILNELEDKNFLYVGVLTHAAAVFCDSFNCGGVGAKWCIGTKNNPEYFAEYRRNGSLFVMAFNKNSKAYDYKKLMFDFRPSLEPTIWDQENNSNNEQQFESLSLKKGVIVAKTFIDNIAKYKTIYSPQIKKFGLESYLNPIRLSEYYGIYYEDLVNDKYPKASLLSYYNSGNHPFTVDFGNKYTENIFGSKDNSIDEIFTIISNKIGLKPKGKGIKIIFVNLKTPQIRYDSDIFRHGSFILGHSNVDKFIWDKQHEGASLRIVYFDSFISTVVLAKNSQLDEIYYTDLVDDDVIGNTIFED